MKILLTLHGLPFYCTHGRCYYLCINGKLRLILTRKYEQAKGKSLNKTEFRKIKCLIAKQITDEEKIILAGIDSSFTIDNVDKGAYVLRTFQDKLASNASRFQSKKYTPDTRILTYLRVRSKEFNVPLPLFMKKRSVDKGK